MKKLLFLLVLSATFTSCKNDSKTENESLTLIQGDFVYYADAAVIQTSQEVYGVVIDKKMHELDDQVKPYKVEATDMVPVEIKGLIIPKPKGEEGWPFLIEIKEILHVSKPDPNKNDVVKLGSQE